MKSMKALLALPLLLCTALIANGQHLDSLYAAIFPDAGPVALDTGGVTFTDTFSASNSFWASPFSEEYVYHGLLTYTHSGNSDRSYELRIGKGGQIYSFITSAGETVPPQYPATAPWVDEVWQMVAVDGSLNDPPNNEKYFIHQAGVYLKTPEQTLPFYSPIVARYFNPEDKSYTVVSWGQQAHTADNLISGHTSSILYYTRFRNVGNGIIQVDLLMYNFGADTIDFINIPWGGVRRSTYDYWFSSLPDLSYQQEVGSYGTYLEQLPNTGGWAAWSTDSSGHAPSLALIMDNTEGVLRMGDAGTIANRDYTVYEGIKFPGNTLTSGKAVRARNFYLIDSDIDSIHAQIVQQNLANETFYGSFNQQSHEVDSAHIALRYQGETLTAHSDSSGTGISLKLQPYQDSNPLFLLYGTNGETRITSDPYGFSSIPHDGTLAGMALVGFLDHPTNIFYEEVVLCAGDDYVCPDGTILINVVEEKIHISDMGTASNGFDSLVYTHVLVSPDDLFVSATLRNGPAGVGNTKAGSPLALWLDASRAMGADSTLSAGSPLDQWIDLSGHNRHYSNSGLHRPVVQLDQDLFSIHFDPASADPRFLTGIKSENLPYGSLYMVVKAQDSGPLNPLFSNANTSIQYEQLPNTGFIGYSESGLADHVSSIPSVFNQTVRFFCQTDCANNEMYLQLGNQSDTMSIGASSNGIPLGNLGSLSQRMAGDIYEIIVFQNHLNLTQQILVDNYLSAKYGGLDISFDLYDEDDLLQGDFDENVAGIGRIHAQDQHTKGQGTGILEVSNPTNLDAGEFMIWGDNGGALTLTDSTDLPATLIARSEKVWRVSIVDTASNLISVGEVDLRFDLEGLTGYELERMVLLIDKDLDGSFADDILIASSQVLTTDYEGQATLCFQGILLEDGQRFCLAGLAPKAPGGVFEDLALWLAADDKTTTSSGTQISTWGDKSENGYVASGASGPEISTSAAKLINYQPVMSLDGVGDKFEVPGGILGNNTYSDIHIFLVHRLNTAPHVSTILREAVTGGTGISSHLPWSNGRVFWDAGINSGDGRIHTPSGLAAGDHAMWELISHDGISDYQAIVKNGKVLASDNSAIALTGANASFFIGSAGGGLYSNGDIAEVIVYLGNESLQTNEQEQIRSHLALKYGYTLSHEGGGSLGDYRSSIGMSIWDADLNSNYHHDVIGLVRDDQSDLHQKQSLAEDEHLKLYTGDLAASNALHSSQIKQNPSSIILGHNEGMISDPFSGTNPEQPTNISSRLEREWKVTNTNFTDEFSFILHCSGCGNFPEENARILIDEDGDFSNAVIWESPDAVVFPDSIVISGVDTSMIPLNSTRYMTIGSAAPVFPVQLLSFEAEVERNIVWLSWLTAGETTDDFYVIERSANGTAWESVLVVPSQREPQDPQPYQAPDQHPIPGTSFYRLKAVGQSGGISYSDVVEVYLPPPYNEIELYPNPVGNMLYIEGDVGHPSGIKVLSLLNQEIHSIVPIQRSADRIELDLSELPSGIFVIKVEGMTWKVVKK